jgi:hypothetical protein
MVMTKQEALDQIALKHGHKDWVTARFRLPEKHLHILILEAMDLYREEHRKTLSQIENLMERWHHATDNDKETLQKINDELVEIGMLGWFNDKK